jgi:UPF0176 protein
MAEKFSIILFYKFIRIEDPEAFRIAHRSLCEAYNLKGRMLIATEGVNATFEGLESDIKNYQNKLHEDPMFADMVFKESEGFGKAFTKLAVKVRPEVVTLEAGEFDIAKETAPELTADELENLYASGEDFVVLDLRNDYEIMAGEFEKTVNPKLRNFRDLPGKLGELEDLKNKKVVAVCTGGIRCEKATCLLKKEGFNNLYQLKDGIHTYIQKYPGKRFKGSLFVFDNRMVTPVVENIDREILGKCFYCDNKSEDFYSDDSVRPSKKIICCKDCILIHSELRNCVTNLNV